MTPTLFCRVVLIRYAKTLDDDVLVHDVETDIRVLLNSPFNGMSSKGLSVLNVLSFIGVLPSIHAIELWQLSLVSLYICSTSRRVGISGGQSKSREIPIPLESRCRGWATYICMYCDLPRFSYWDSCSFYFEFFLCMLGPFLFIIFRTMLTVYARPVHRLQYSVTRYGQSSISLFVGIFWAFPVHGSSLQFLSQNEVEGEFMSLWKARHSSLSWMTQTWFVAA